MPLLPKSWPIVFVLPLLACGSDDGQRADIAGPADTAVEVADTAVADTVQLEDTLVTLDTVEDTIEDIVPETLEDTVADTTPDEPAVVQCSASPFETGCECQADAECASGRCDEGPWGSFCTGACDADEDCVGGATCVKPAGESEGLCLFEEDFLCAPCVADGDCRRSGGNARCLTFGGASYCGFECEAKADCPSGFNCDAGMCRPINDRCDCTELAADLGLQTSCSLSNAYGTCQGIRVCETDGTLTDCNAAVPREEICNGLDDDCSGVADGIPGACDDDNPCTTDVCAGEAGCTHTNDDTAKCIDFDPCTTNDSCVEGVCVGTFVPALCECTDAEDCQVPVGKERQCYIVACVDRHCAVAPHAGSCDDRSACTAGDTCSAGRCEGTALSCDDGEPCTTDSCDPVTGCAQTDHNGPCDDGDRCTDDDSCATGACVGETYECASLDGACYVGVCDGEGGCVAQALTCGVTGVRFHLPTAALAKRGSSPHWFRASFGHGGLTGRGAGVPHRIHHGFHPGMHR